MVYPSLRATVAKRVHTGMGTGVVQLPVVFEWSVIKPARRLDEQHQFLGGVPSVYGHRDEGKLLIGLRVNEHVAYMIKLCLAVAVAVGFGGGVKNSIAI